MSYFPVFCIYSTFVLLYFIFSFYLTQFFVFFSFSTGEITTREPLDRETRGLHELVVEARDQGTPSRAARVPLKVIVLDVNDNSPEIVDPQGDVVSVREEQPSGTEVARVRALDTDLGENASVTYTILKGEQLFIFYFYM